MKKFIIFMFVLFLFAAPIKAQTPAHHGFHPITFIKKNKAFIITTLIFVGSDIADTEETIQAQKRCPTCVETGDAYGPHPSSQRLWVESSAFDAAYIWIDWFGTRDSGLTGAGDFTPEEKAKHPNLYKLCWLEKPATVGVMLWWSEKHAHAAYNNAQIPVTRP